MRLQKWQVSCRKLKNKYAAKHRDYTKKLESIVRAVYEPFSQIPDNVQQKKNQHNQLQFSSCSVLIQIWKSKFCIVYPVSRC